MVGNDMMESIVAVDVVTPQWPKKRTAHVPLDISEPITSLVKALMDIQSTPRDLWPP